MSQRLSALVTSALLVGTLVVGAPSPARAVANNIYIGFDTPADTGSCASPDYTADGTDDHDVIMDAVTATNPGGTLHLCPGTYDINATINLAGKLITLQGASAATTTLDGGGTVQILSSSGAITVSALTFQDGYGTYGGAIYADTATVSSSTFTNNTAVFGGAIYANAGTVTVNHSTLTGNTATYFGGAIFASTATTVTASTLTGNTATYYGGAIVAWDTATVANSTFTGNRANASGAIYADTATITRSRFTKNQAIRYDGGAISARTGTIARSRFTRNTAVNHGGAVYFWQAEKADLLQLRRNSFIGNRAGAGGAITLASCGRVYRQSQLARIAAANQFSMNRATKQRRTTDIETAEYCD